MNKKDGNQLVFLNQKGDVKIFFIHAEDELLSLLKKYSGKGYNFYVGINERCTGGTKGIYVKSVKILVIDIDAIIPCYGHNRNIKQPATEYELMLAETFADKIIKLEFTEKGFKRPIKCMSGNGWQLWSAIPEIKITDKNRASIDAKIQAFNRQIKQKYTDRCLAKIDNIGDLATVIKLIGTKSIKGREIKGYRPHRISYSTEQLIRNEDKRLKDYILSLTSGNVTRVKNIDKGQILNTKKSLTVDGQITKICNKDNKLKELLQGNIRGFISRSEAEASLISKLIYYNFSKSQVFHIMDNARCSKWRYSAKAYREITYRKALAYFKKCI